MTDAPAPLSDDGVVGAFLSRIFGRSYRTTLAGLAATTCAIVAILPGIDPEAAKTAEKIGLLIGAGGLIVAKDGRVSGRPQ
jgi:glycerol-3-phosphate responsive antiterminator